MCHCVYAASRTFLNSFYTLGTSLYCIYTSSASFFSGALFSRNPLEIPANKDTNRKIHKNNIFHRLLCLNFGSKFLARHAQHPLCEAHIVSDFTCVYCTAAGTIFGTTDVYELGFSYLSISIFKFYRQYLLNLNVFPLHYKKTCEKNFNVRHFEDAFERKFINL